MSDDNRKGYRKNYYQKNKEGIEQKRRIIINKRKEFRTLSIEDKNIDNWYNLMKVRKNV